MDNELRDMLVKIMENQNELGRKVDGLGETVGSLEEIVNKNSLVLEEVKVNIKKIAEVQQNSMDITDKSFNSLKEELAEKYSLHSAAIQDVSKDIKFIKHKEFENEQDIFEIKDRLKIVK